MTESSASSTEKLKKVAKPQPHEPLAQPCRSTQYRLHHTFCTLQRLYLTLQCFWVCPRLATHTLAGLCALWLLSGASSTENSR